MFSIGALNVDRAPITTFARRTRHAAEMSPRGPRWPRYLQNARLLQISCFTTAQQPVAHLPHPISSPGSLFLFVSLPPERGTRSAFGKRDGFRSPRLPLRLRGNRLLRQPALITAAISSSWTLSLARSSGILKQRYVNEIRGVGSAGGSIASALFSRRFSRSSARDRV